VRRVPLVKNTEPGLVQIKNRMDFFKMVYIEIKCPYLTSIPSLSPVKLRELLPKAKFCKIKKQL
jgi:hypothetical protein